MQRMISYMNASPFQVVIRSPILMFGRERSLPRRFAGIYVFVGRRDGVLVLAVDRRSFVVSVHPKQKSRSIRNLPVGPQSDGFG